MKKKVCVLFCLLLLLSSCASPAAEVTPTPEETDTPMPAYTWWVIPDPTPEPTPEPTPFLSYEDYFAQRIFFGTDMDDRDIYFEHVRRSQDYVAPGLAFAQERLEDTEGLIPKTLTWVADRSLYVFWAGTEENLSLYRLYLPSESLECLYTIPAEDMENYYYVPQSETAAHWVDGQVGERVCLLGGTGTYSNYEFFWGHYNKDFLEAYDYVMSNPEEYPQYFEEGPMGDQWDTAAWMEHDDFCHYTVHYINTDSGRQDSRPSGIYIDHGLWWVEE